MGPRLALEAGGRALSGSEPGLAGVALLPGSCSYLVMPFMGTDLGKLMKHERLSEDRIQFLVYQMLKGLKVRTGRGAAGGGRAVLYRELTPLALSVPTVHPCCWCHPQGESWWWREPPLAVWAFGGLSSWDLPLLACEGARGVSWGEHLAPGLGSLGAQAPPPFPEAAGAPALVPPADGPRSHLSSALPTGPEARQSGGERGL